MATMKVVMLKDVKGVGQRGKVIDVADGFALNSLIPSGKAVQATAEKIAQVQKQLESASLEKAKHDAELTTKIRALDGKTVTIKARANEKGHLFKAIKKEDVADAIGHTLNALSFIPDPDMISGIGEAIKNVGDFVAHIGLDGIEATFHVIVQAL